MTRRPNISGGPECCENCGYCAPVRSVPPDEPIEDQNVCLVWVLTDGLMDVVQAQPWDMCEMWTARP